MIKTVLFYALSDPALFFVLTPLAAYRVWRMLTRKARGAPLLDSLLLASLVYFMMLIVLRLNSLYYVLPAYAFALPALGMFLGRIKL